MKRKVTPSSTSMSTATGYAFVGSTTLSTTAPSSNSICAFSAAAASSSLGNTVIDLVDSTDEDDSIWIIPCSDSVAEFEDDVSWAADSGNESDGDKKPAAKPKASSMANQEVIELMSSDEEHEVKDSDLEAFA